MAHPTMNWQSLPSSISPLVNAPDWPAVRRDLTDLQPNLKTHLESIVQNQKEWIGLLAGLFYCTTARDYIFLFMENYS
uniref:Uncharacterized protein n=1 Tax=Nelumbo nucifera TaxID=4432 RepID=A0A822ZW57_NELNU|nr:TPA_asm: hypothetical protein HUJ06_004388 [Nelumbo nucifera]